MTAPAPSGTVSTPPATSTPTAPATSTSTATPPPVYSLAGDQFSVIVVGIALLLAVAVAALVSSWGHGR